MTVNFVNAIEVKKGYAIGDYPDSDTGKTETADSTNQPVEVQKKDGKIAKAWSGTGGVFSQGDHLGTVATVTYTNLSKSYYVDPRTGAKKLFSKLVLTYGNMRQNKQTSGNQALFIYDNMSVGAAIINSGQIEITNIQAYDESGNLINIVPGTAWLVTGSLNIWDWQNGVPSPYPENIINEYPYVGHREKVGVSGSNKIYEWAVPAGHGVWGTKHGNWIYPEPSGLGKWPENLMPNDDGIAIIEYHPGSSIIFAYEENDANGIRYGMDGKPYTANPLNKDQTFFPGAIGSSNWYQFSLSTFMKPSSELVREPTPQSTPVSYHYNVAQAKRVYSTTERETRSLAMTKKCQNSDKNLSKYLVKNEADYGHKPLILW